MEYLLGLGSKLKNVLAHGLYLLQRQHCLILFELGWLV